MTRRVLVGLGALNVSENTGGGDQFCEYRNHTGPKITRDCPVQEEVPASTNYTHTYSGTVIITCYIEKECTNGALHVHFTALHICFRKPLKLL